MHCGVEGCPPEYGYKVTSRQESEGWLLEKR